jgi:hypothetical protein
MRARPRRLTGRRIALVDLTPARDLGARTVLSSTTDANEGVNTPAVAPNRVSGVWTQDGRLVTEAVSVGGRAVELEFRVRPDQVDLWRGRYLEACFDRVVLSAWMGDLMDGAEVEDLTCDEVTLGVGPQGRMALTVAEGFGRPAIELWELSPTDSAALRAGI